MEDPRATVDACTHIPTTNANADANPIADWDRGDSRPPAQRHCYGDSASVTHSNCHVNGNTNAHADSRAETDSNGQTSTALCPQHINQVGGGACFNDARVQVERT